LYGIWFGIPSGKETVQRAKKNARPYPLSTRGAKQVSRLKADKYPATILFISRLLGVYMNMSIVHSVELPYDKLTNKK